MEESKNIKVFKSLFTSIQEMFEFPSAFLVNVAELQDIFYENLSEILQLCLDIQISPARLLSLKSLNIENLDEAEVAGYLTRSLENEKSYIVLNYYLGRYIQSIFSTVKPEEENDILHLMIANGISETMLQNLHDAYQKLTAMEKLKHLHA